jgi:hypothetical protein
VLSFSFFSLGLALWLFLSLAQEKPSSIHRFARWYIFGPKIPIWVNFGGPWNGKVYKIPNIL